MLRDELIEDMKCLGGFWLYLIISFVFLILGEFAWGVLLLVSLAVAFVVIILVRLAYFKPRPAPYKIKGVYSRIDASSFPSMHSARAAILAVILSYYFRSPALTAVFVVCALGVSAARVVSRKHFLTDVIAGLVLGVVIAFACFLVLGFKNLGF